MPKKSVARLRELRSLTAITPGPVPGRYVLSLATRACAANRYLGAYGPIPLSQPANVAITLTPAENPLPNPT